MERTGSHEKGKRNDTIMQPPSAGWYTTNWASSGGALVVGVHHMGAGVGNMVHSYDPHPQVACDTR